MIEVYLTMRIIFFLLLLLLTGNVMAQSQQPQFPQPAKVTQQQADPEKTVRETTNEQRGTEKSPIVIKVLPTREIEEDAKQVQKERQEKAELDRKLTDYTKDLAIFTAVLACAAFLQLFVFGLQALKLHQTVKATKESADAALKTAQNMEAAERAYVKMSHLPPGVIIGKNETTEWIEVTVEVGNHGRTPASVTDVIVDAKVLENGDRLPTPFPYHSWEREAFPNAFLVAGESFLCPTKTLPLRPHKSSDIISGAKKLWVFGHVDYIDTFGQRYRGGWVRVYRHNLPGQSQDNLIFMTEGRYNYDRPRKQGESNDWNEPSA